MTNKNNNLKKKIRLEFILLWKGNQKDLGLIDFFMCILLFCGVRNATNFLEGIYFYIKCMVSEITCLYCVYKPTDSAQLM